MSNLVIVAIPDENDQVWKVSSEKVPHMTLLFLGDVDQVANLESIVGFVEHATNTTLCRFNLPVDRRGELGNDQADVLFFKKNRYDYKAIRDFRAALLQDSNIKTAYDSATQFEGPWTPHLTLGYPGSPAKPDADEFGFYDVRFDKIAVWTEDFDGPEFVLEDYWDKYEALEAVPMDVAMSALRHVSEEAWSNWTKADYTLEQWHAACLVHTHEGEPTSKSECKLPVKTPNGVLNRNGVHAAAAALAGARGGLKGISEEQKTKAQNALRRYYAQLDEELPESLAQSTFEIGADFVLEHYGVKGMRWGVRKENVSGTARAVGSVAKATGGAVGKAAKATVRFAGDVSFETRVENGRAREAVIDAAVKPYAKEDLPALKARHGDYAKLRNRVRKPFSAEAKAYRKDARETYIKRLETEANKMKNPSGTREYTIRERGIDQPAEGGALPTSRYFWDVTARDVKHAFEDDFTRLEVLTDDEGWITGLKKVKIENSMAQTADLGSEYILEHFGVKGMRWGVRKAKAGAIGTAKVADNILFELGTQNRYVQQGIANDASKTLKKKDLPTIKEKHGAAGKKFNRIKAPLSSEARAYRKDVKAAYLKRLEEAANARTNFQGSRRYTMAESGKPNTSQYFWKIRTEKIQHAVDGEDEFMVRPIFDDDGWIIDLEIQSAAKKEMSQSVDLSSVLISTLLNGSTIEHFGVKGMRWGVRKRREAPMAVTPSARSQVPHGKKRKTKIKTEGGENHPASDDAIRVAESRAKLNKSGTAALSNQELREVANRLQLEAQVATLTSSRGRKFVMRELETTSQQLTKKGVKKGAKRYGPGVAKKVKKAAATAAVTAVL